MGRLVIAARVGVGCGSLHVCGMALDALCRVPQQPDPTYVASVACQLFWACNIRWPCRVAVLAFVTPLLPRLRYLPVSVSVLRGTPVKIVYHLVLSAEIQVRSHVCYLCRRDSCCSMYALSGTLAVHRSVDMRGLHSWVCTSRCGGAYNKNQNKAKEQQEGSWDGGRKRQSRRKARQKGKKDFQ